MIDTSQRSPSFIKVESHRNNNNVEYQQEMIERGSSSEHEVEYVPNRDDDIESDDSEASQYESGGQES
jgi:hypothetical protein